MNEKTIYALGFFDGVHKGHQTLLYACRRMAEQAGVGMAAITFEKHPKALFETTLPGLINTTADRCELLRRYGMDTVLTYPVNEAVMGMPWREFLLELYRCHGARGFVCGYDFRFGHKGLGNAEKVREFCAEFGLPCVIVPEQNLDGVRVSSTYIRALLEQGDMETANRFLGHPHMLAGQVVAGKQLGRTLGFPTANLAYPADLVEMKRGVYACKVWVDDQGYMAVVNIGTRPTVKGEGVTVEAHLLDFAGDLYGKTIRVAFYKFLRPEKNFANLSALQEEIRENVCQTRKIFEKSE